MPHLARHARCGIPRAGAWATQRHNHPFGTQRKWLSDNGAADQNGGYRLSGVGRAWLPNVTGLAVWEDGLSSRAPRFCG
jgi:hypothetical protein